MELQLSLENVIYNLAKNNNDPAVLIMDRGLMDTAGYIGWPAFNKIIEKTGWNVSDLRDNRYDAIIHLVTAADGAPSFYDFGNTARYESPEEAVERDRALRTAYLGHNNVFFVDNKHKGGFAGKMNYTIATINSLLGLPINMTRYKKFLLEQDDAREFVSKEEFHTYHINLFRQMGI